MLKNFAFAFADEGASPDDDDPLSCPRSLPDQYLFRAMTTSDSPELDSAHISHFETGNRKSIQNSQSLLSLEAQSSEAGLNPSIDPDQVRIQIQMHPASIPWIELDPKPAEPIVAHSQSQFQQHQRHASIESQSDDQSDDTIAGVVNGIRKRDGLRRPTQEPSRSASPSKRRPNLLANMIESGEQCNVQNSASHTAMASSPPLPPFLINLMASAKFDDNMNPPFMDDEMELEVDEDHCSRQEESSGSSAPITLRDAEAPAGIRKFVPKYRTSVDAASRCKNMRRSVPRMRRRPKTHQSESTSSRSEASTNSTPL
ncbi:hypothetical protein F4818DRAFT_306347 [Hypoxylon cercidicola]|nr:hypothetical protein F4818DRAFT_306347 [Hypoxylon cercidicola]